MYILRSKTFKSWYTLQWRRTVWIVTRSSDIIILPPAYVRAVTGIRLHERLVAVWKLVSGWRVLRPANSFKVLRGFPRVEGWVGVQNSHPTPCFTCSPRRSNFKVSALHTRISAHIEQVAKRSSVMENRMRQWGCSTLYGETSAWFCME
jgi:hypothetical protein